MFILTEQMFMTDSYLRSFEAKIVKISEDNLNVYLDRTAFYPGGGGQPNDEGVMKIAEQICKVNKVGRDQNREIYHRLEKPLDISPDEIVSCEVDWDKRYKIMRTHTALHILCGLIWKEFGAVVTGGNMSLEKARMDFNLVDFSQDRVDYIEKRVNEEVKNKHDVVIKILSREEAFQIPDLIRTKINLLPPQIKEVRTVEIVGLDLQADGGTHVKNTKEVGKIKIVETINKGKENKRIIIQLDD
ncbi:MAG: alanyl-tRNA editing protein [Candidatus Heimdallarchaeota archaeon]